jgi:hypothetical protein
MHGRAVVPRREIWTDKEPKKLTVLSLTLPSTILPVLGSTPSWPEQKRIFPTMVAWLRKGGGAGASAVKTGIFDIVI